MVLAEKCEKWQKTSEFAQINPPRPVEFGASRFAGVFSRCIPKSESLASRVFATHDLHFCRGIYFERPCHPNTFGLTLDAGNTFGSHAKSSRPQTRRVFCVRKQNQDCPAIQKL
jgi:hypothetical protein